MSTMPDHLRPITVEIPVTWTADRRSPFGRCSTHCATKSGSVTAANCKICWPRSSDAQASTGMRVLGLSTSDRLIVHHLKHRPQRPSCCSIKTAILPSRPARAHAVARSSSPGCPQGIAEGDAQRPGRLRARRHSHRRDGRRCDSPCRCRRPRTDQDASFRSGFTPPLTDASRSIGSTRRLSSLLLRTPDFSRR
jgi:hypothetical protein